MPEYYFGLKVSMTAMLTARKKMPQQKVPACNSGLGRSSRGKSLRFTWRACKVEKPSDKLPRTTPISAIAIGLKKPEDHHSQSEIERQDAVINETHLAAAEPMSTAAGRPDHVGPAPGDLVAHADLARGQNQETASKGCEPEDGAERRIAVGDSFSRHGRDPIAGYGNVPDEFQ